MLTPTEVKAVLAAHGLRPSRALAGGSAELDLWFGEGRRIDPLVATLAEPRLLEEERSALRVVSA